MHCAANRRQAHARASNLVIYSLKQSQLACLLEQLQGSNSKQGGCQLQALLLWRACPARRTDLYAFDNSRTPF
jgi:hypothetical protein